MASGRPKLLFHAVIQGFQSGIFILLEDLSQEPLKETLHSPHDDNSGVDLDIVQHMRKTHEEGPTRGEDWEEVRSLVLRPNLLQSSCRKCKGCCDKLLKHRPAVPQVSSQASSVSSCDDYIILPDCFDTSRPLGESVHGSATALPAIAAVTSADEPQEEGEEEEKDSTLTAQRGREEQREEVEAEESAENTWPPPGPRVSGSVSQLLCTSQTLDAVMLTPEVLPPIPLLSPPALYSPRLDQPPPQEITTG